MIRKLVYAVWFVMAAILVYGAAGPWLVLHSLRNAVEHRDAAGLNSLVDYPALRENLKDHFRQGLSRTLAEEGDSSAAGAMSLYLADGMVSGLVDMAVTPEGLSRMMTGAPPVPGETEASRNPGMAPREAWFAETRSRYEGTSRFLLTVRDKEGRELQFVLDRAGLAWRLTDIRF